MPKGKRGDLNISFGWLFAIIVGAAILVLTIFGVAKVIKTGQQEQTTIGSAELGVLLNPLETGFESAVSTFISTRIDTRIYNSCFSAGNFGEQRISLSEFSFNEWTIPSSEASFENKYIFSRKVSEGKKFYLFSKPFEFPFKISDVIYMTSEKEKYCFEDAPEEIEEEIIQIKQENLAVGCDEKPDYIKVCFEKSNCDINVDYDLKYAEKGGSKVYFEGDSLMYSAIFSDKEIYECQVQRLMKRMRSLAELYEEKSLLMKERGCDSGLGEDLDSLGKIELKSSSELSDINDFAEEIQNKNKYSECRLW